MKTLVNDDLIGAETRDQQRVIDRWTAQTARKAERGRLARSERASRAVTVQQVATALRVIAFLSTAGVLLPPRV